MCSLCRWLRFTRYSRSRSDTNTKEKDLKGREIISLPLNKVCVVYWVVTFTEGVTASEVPCRHSGARERHGGGTYGSPYGFQGHATLEQD